MTEKSLSQLRGRIEVWARELGFEQTGVADCDLSHVEQHLHDWLDQGWHGDMDFMAAHGTKRTRPPELVPGTRRVISVRMNYLPDDVTPANSVLDDPRRAYVARYAVGRDYHKVLRNRLEALAQKIRNEVGGFGYRVFTDSAPVMEVELANKAGLGWRGKHTLLLNRDAGSWFFLGEIYTNLDLPVDQPQTEHCGDCTRCMDICPTQAIIAPYKLDARRCISYLTIEHKGSIPVEFRPLIGNRIYGCDDCQLVCPWNRFAQKATLSDFDVRNGLDSSDLVSLFAWDEQMFDRNTRGSAIRRIGHERWLRNIACSLGNAVTSAEVVAALDSRADHPSALVREHVAWAIAQHLEAGNSVTDNLLAT
jgi:epoxyqueuosine reductase